MIIKQLNRSEFERAFIEMRPDNFSGLALLELYDYYDQFEAFNLDVIAVCCDWTEYDADDLISDFGYMIDLNEYEDQEEKISALIEELEQNTTILKVDHYDKITYLVQAF